MDKIFIVSTDNNFIEKIKKIILNPGIEILVIMYPEDLLKNELLYPANIILFDYDYNFVKKYNLAKEKFDNLKKTPVITFSKEGFIFDFIGEFRNNIIENLSNDFEEKQLLMILEKNGMIIKKTEEIRIEEKKAEEVKKENILDLNIISQLKDKKILIIDDIIENIKFIKTMFGNEIQVMESYDGDDGYKNVLLKKPDILFLDIVLPKLNGFELLKRVKENKDFQNLFVILNSTRNKDLESYNDITDKNNIFFIKRPIITDELSKILQNYIKK